MEEQIKKQLDRIEAYASLAAKKVITLQEAVLLTGLKPQALRKKAREREIPSYKPNHNLLYFKKDELEAWMMHNRTSSIEEELRKYR